jgi:hypothetical protein
MGQYANAGMTQHGEQIRISKERRQRTTPPSEQPLELWQAEEELSARFERTSWGSFVPKRRS